MRNSGLRKRWYCGSAIFLVFAAACTTPQPSPTAVPTEIVTPVAIVKATETPVPLPTLTPTPAPVTIAVPPRWELETRRALAQQGGDNSKWIWELLVVDDPAAALENGAAQLALVAGDLGVPAGARPKALVVLFSSNLSSISLEEAQQAVDEDPFWLALMDWADMPPTHKALRVDGKMPNDPDYPFHFTWSIISNGDFEQAAGDLGPWLVAEISRDDVFQMAAVGDVMLDRLLGDALRRGDLEYPFSGVLDQLRQPDLTIGNFESAIGESGKPQPKTYTFQAPANAIDSLLNAGFDLVTVANNHALDYGREAFVEGLEMFAAAGLPTVGGGRNREQAHSPTILEVQGKTIAFLGYLRVPVGRFNYDYSLWQATAGSPGIAWAYEKNIREDVAAIRPDVDLVIVLIHSGFEGYAEPSPAQQSTSRAAIDAGADLVIGHHSHVLQGVEFYKSGVIAYGLGNFAFTDGGRDLTSALLNVWLDAGGVRQLEYVPVILGLDGRPELASGQQATDILLQINYLTRLLN